MNNTYTIFVCIFINVMMINYPFEHICEIEVAAFITAAVFVLLFCEFIYFICFMCVDPLSAVEDIWLHFWISSQV